MVHTLRTTHTRPDKCAYNIDVDSRSSTLCGAQTTDYIHIEIATLLPRIHFHYTRVPHSFPASPWRPHRRQKFALTQPCAASLRAFMFHPPSLYQPFGAHILMHTFLSTNSAATGRRDAYPNHRVLRSQRQAATPAPKTPTPRSRLVCQR